MGGKQKVGRGIRSQVLFETFNAFSPVDVKGGEEFAGRNFSDHFVEKHDSCDSAEVATLEGRGKDYAGRFKYRPVRLQSARASCESSKGRKRNNNKGHGNKGGEARPARLFGKGYLGNKINRGSLSCYSGYCW